MTTAYQATVTREDGWWMVHVPEVDGLTQARRLADVERMGRELVAVTLDIEVEDVELNIRLEVAGVSVESVVSKIERERAEAARLEADASREARELAKRLTKHDVPLRDVGTILGVSYQRAHQLVTA